MPINKALMYTLQKRYGAEEGKRIYYKMEAKGQTKAKKYKIHKAGV